MEHSINGTIFSGPVEVPLIESRLYNESVTAAFYIKKTEKKSLIDIHGFESNGDLLIRSSGKISRSRPNFSKKDNF